MAATMDGVMEIDYHVYSETPEEDEYILARALADYTAEEENFISLETNAPVFVFAKHPSGWWTGESKGRYGLFPSNFVIEEFHVTAVPKPAGELTESDISELRRASSAGDSDTDSDSDGVVDSDEEDEDDGKEESAPENASPPIPIPITPEKRSPPQPAPLILPVENSFNFNDTSKLTPVSRQLGEFVDRINETRSPASSVPTTPTHPFATPPPRKKGALTVARRESRRDLTGSPTEDLGPYDIEQSKLTPVSRQLGEFVERLNQGRTPGSANGSLSMGTSRSARAGEPIFNVFDGLLADIESLRAGPQEGEWDEEGGEDVYNTPEAARARIAIDVRALKEELEQAKSERMSMESDIVRLREEFAIQLEAERNGRRQLERQLSAKSLQSVASSTADDEEEVAAGGSQPSSPVSDQLSSLKEANRKLESDLDHANEEILKLKKQGELSAISSLQANHELIEELDRLRTVNKRLEAEINRLNSEAKPKSPSEKPTHPEEEVKALRAELDAQKVAHDKLKGEHSAQKTEFERIKEEQIREQNAKHKSALDTATKGHEETKKRLETERDQAREAEATKAKEVEELKAQLQKLKADLDAKTFKMPEKPAETEPKKPAAAPPKLARSQPAQPSPSQGSQPGTVPNELPRPRRLSDAQSNPVPTIDQLSTSAPVRVVPVGSHHPIATTHAAHQPASTTHGFATPTHPPHTTPTHSSQPSKPEHATPTHPPYAKPVAKPAAPTPTHDKPVVAPTPAQEKPAVATPVPEQAKEEQAKPEQPKPPARRALPHQPEVSTDHNVSSPDLSSPRMGSTAMQRAQSHDAVPVKQLGTAGARPPRPLRSPQPSDAPAQPSFPPITENDEGGDKGPRKLGGSSAFKRPGPSRPLPLEGADNSLESNALFQQRRLSTQGLDQDAAQQQHAAPPTTSPPPVSHHPLRRTVSTQPAQGLRDHVSFKTPASKP